MRTFLWFSYFTGYLILSTFRIIRLNYIKKYGTEEDIKEYIHMAASTWGQGLVKKTGSKIIVIGEENLPEGNCLFVGNHQSNFDIPILLGYINKSMGFIAKKELEKFPIISNWMKQMKCIFMDRENIRESIKSINEGVEILKSGQSMVIFPEGTRSKSNDMKEFKKGSMKLGTKAGVPIVPITIAGSYKIYEGNGNKIRPAEVKIIISKPINPNDLNKEEQGNLAQTIQNIILNNLENKGIH